MENDSNFSSRRTFVKGLGLAAATPLFHSISSANVGEEGKDKNRHRVMSANIRVALPEDEKEGVGWNVRKQLCMKVIQQHKPDIICLQEVLKVQMDDMRKAFSKFEGFGFDGPEMDPIQTGYHGIAKNPIFFLRDRYELRSGGTYFLSESPLIGGSKSWETARARNCNWVRLKDRKTGTEFRVINTHLDHINQEARGKQTEAILKETEQYHRDFPQLFAGDFNSRADSNVMGLIKAAGWTESYEFIHGKEGDEFTFHDFKGAAYAKQLKEKGTKGGRIDFIFSKGNVSAQASSIITDEENGLYPSDHYFLYADLKI